MRFPKLIKHILFGDGRRRSNFHDLRGNWIGIRGLFYLPDVIVTTFLRKFFGLRPETPWISYRARKKIGRLIQPDGTVLEFGSGMSTLWLARRCKTLYSVEHDALWFQTVQSKLAAKNIANAHCFLREMENYADLSAFPDESFDFVLVDGAQRAACVQAVLKKLKPGGWVYLDNTDSAAMKAGSKQNSPAEDLLLEAVKHNNGSVEYFTDFAPTMFVVNQGMLVRLSIFKQNERA
jgi:hypothetical protein